MNIQIRSISTKDVKIAQVALESIGFVTTREGDAVDAYWVEMSVPEKFAHGECKVTLLYGVKENEEVTIKW
jgi:hypothetical protein